MIKANKKLFLCFETNIMQNATNVSTSAGKINSMACNAANLQANITLSALLYREEQRGNVLFI